VEWEPGPRIEDRGSRIEDRKTGAGDPRSSILDPRSSGARGAVMSQYLGVMEQFLDVQRQVTEQFLAARPRSMPPAPRPLRPLLGDVVRSVAGRELVARRRLDLAEDLFALDHTLAGRGVSRVNPDQNGLPVIPVTFVLEMMAEAAERLVPGKVVVGLQ